MDYITSGKDKASFNFTTESLRRINNNLINCARCYKMNDYISWKKELDGLYKEAYTVLDDVDYKKNKTLFTDIERLKKEIDRENSAYISAQNQKIQHFNTKLPSLLEDFEIKLRIAVRIFYGKQKDYEETTGEYYGEPEGEEDA
jgi:hypothetical protein